MVADFPIAIGQGHLGTLGSLGVGHHGYTGGTGPEHNTGRRHGRIWIRSERRREEVENALARQVELADRLTFAYVDLTKDDGWDEAMEGATYLLHVASPVGDQEPKDEDELIVPARDGCRRAIFAAIRAGVRRTVLTSSIAAVYLGHDRGRPAPFGHQDWSDTSADIGAYGRSKTLAEQLAWKLVEGTDMELVTINPGYVLGPTLIPDSSPSVEIVGKLLRREVPGCPDVRFNLVDVRDVADAHVAAMTAPDAAGKRFLMGSESVPMIEIARVLDRTFSERGFRIPVRSVPKLVVRFVALFDKTVRLVIDDIGRTTRIETEPARNVLGWKPRPMDEMVVDTAHSLVEHELV